MSKSEMMRYCAVLGCRSTAVELRTWRKGSCKEHEGKSRDTCGCPDPFALFPFPAPPKFRSGWLNRIGLPELEVSDATRVCSLHFVEGKPTSRSPFPTLYLQPDISDDESESSNDSEQLQPYIESTYSCGEDPLNCEDSNECSREEANEDLMNEERDMDDDFSSNDFSLKMPTENAKDMINPEEADCEDEVVLMEQKEEMRNSDEDVEVTYQKPKVVPLASYDPQAQVLQISNPVKYISECHNRIAQLLAEKEEMKKSYEREIERLKYLNTSLKRRFLNSNKRFNTAAQSSNPRKPRNVKKLKILANLSQSGLSLS